MTLQYVGLIDLPYCPIVGVTTPGFSNILVDADDEGIAFIYRVPKAGNLRKIGFRTATITTGGDLTGSIQTVDATTGFPTGTLWATNTSCTITVNAADDNVWKEGTLTADATVVADDTIAIVFRRPTSGTLNGNLAAPAIASTGWIPFVQSSYSPTYTAAAWSTNAAAVSSIGVQYSDGVCYNVFDMVPVTGYSSVAVNNGSSPDNEYGNRFRLPIAARVVGLKLPGDLDGDCQYVLYSDGGTQLAISNTLDKDIRRDASLGRHPAYFTSPCTIAANTWYRATCLPSSATSVSLRKVSCNAQAWLGCFGGGSDFYQTSRNTGTPSTWNDVTTDRLLMSLIIDAIDDGAGSGVGSAVPGFFPGGNVHF